MKKKIYLKSLLALLIISVLLSCKKDEDEDLTPTPPPPQPKPSSLSCKVNDTPFVAANVAIRWVQAAGGVNKIGCEATDADGNSLSFVIVADKPGTYTASGGGTNVSSMDFTYSPQGSMYFAGFGFSDNAVVTFTQVDNYDKNNMEISGTFEFSVRGSNLPDSPYFITDGKFENVRW